MRQTRRLLRDLRRAEQVFYDHEYADRFESVLEQRSWQGKRRGADGRGRQTDDARACEKYGVSDEEHCAWKGTVRASREGRESGDEFYQVRDVKVRNLIFVDIL